jgi:hypothetical protein
MTALTVHNFRRWLLAKKPDEIVGVNRDCHTCPVANFYSDTNGGWEIVVFDRWGEYFIDKGHEKRRAPAWAADFFAAVDGEQNGKITAKRALELLKA